MWYIKDNSVLYLPSNSSQQNPQYDPCVALALRQNIQIRYDILVNSNYVNFSVRQVAHINLVIEAESFFAGFEVTDVDSHLIPFLRRILSFSSLTR